MQAQLSDALRDKSRLEEGKQEMEEKVGRLQKRLEELSVQKENGVGISSQAQALRLAELQAEVGKILKERDEYLKEKIQLEIQVEALTKQVTQLQTDLNASTT